MGLAVVYKDAGARSPTVRIPSSLMEAPCGPGIDSLNHKP